MLTEDTIPTPLGDVVAVVSASGELCALGFADQPASVRRHLRRWQPGITPRPGRLDAVRDALERYFDGDVTALAAVPTAPQGTPFQQRVWAALRQVPVGATTTYGALAAALGTPAAARAVGAANAANPLCLVVPCHRVVPAGGGVGGYAYGPARKRWLLAHEAGVQN